MRRTHQPFAATVYRTSNANQERAGWAWLLSVMAAVWVMAAPANAEPAWSISADAHAAPLSQRASDIRPYGGGPHWQGNLPAQMGFVAVQSAAAKPSIGFDPLVLAADQPVFAEAGSMPRQIQSSVGVFLHQLFETPPLFGGADAHLNDTKHAQADYAVAAMYTAAPAHRAYSF